nr:PTS glucose transporter subunit IIA [Lactobacillus helveticus]
MHLGLDTVELKGKPFIINVKPGDKVKAGTQIGSMDIKAIKEAGKEPVVLTIIANMDYVDHVVRMSDGEVEAGKDVFHVITK